jgi:hypothetical protein
MGSLYRDHFQIKKTERKMKTQNKGLCRQMVAIHKWSLTCSVFHLFWYAKNAYVDSILGSSQFS